MTIHANIDNILKLFKVPIRINRLIKNTVIKNSLIFTFFALLNNGINFLLTLYLADILPKSDFGVLNLFLTLILVFTVLIPLGTQGYISIIFFKKSKEYINKVVNGIFTISSCAFIGITLITTLVYPLTKPFLELPLLYILIAILICFLQILYNTTLEIYRLKEQPIKYGLISLFFVLLNVGLTYFLCVRQNYGWEGRAISQLISISICALLSLSILHRLGYRLNPSFNKNIYRKVLSFGVPLIPHSSSVWIRLGLDRYIINFFHGSAVLASFSYVYNFSGLILMVGTAFNASNSVLIFKSIRDENQLVTEKLRKQTIIMCFFFLGLSLISMILVVFLTHIFFPKYEDSNQYIFPLFLAAFFQCVYYLFVNYLFYFKKTKLLMYITFSISLLHFILSMIITRYSVIGLAYLNLLSNLIICSLVIYYSHKVYPIFKLKNHE